MDNLESWYDRLNQYTSVKGQTGLPSMENVRGMFEQGYTVQETFDSLYPPEPSVYDNTTGLEPAHQVAPQNDQMSSLDLVLAVQANTGPQVTEAQVLAKVVRKTFTLLPEGRTILCEITMQNGFLFHGMATPVSNQNLDVNQGQSRALTKAIQKAWGHEAYLLREQLYQEEMAKLRSQTVGIGVDASS